MSKQLRKFRLRNGAVVQESPREGTVTNETGFIDDYEFHSFGEMSSLDITGFKRCDNYLCLYLPDDSMPKGDAHGKGYDIIEEITD